MKKRNLLNVCFLVFLLFSSCTKEVLVDVPPQLQITIKDENLSPLSDVEVKLYLTLSNWSNDENPYLNLFSDSQGIVLFENLDEQVYFFYAEKETKNNRYGIATHENSLKMNEIKQLDVIIKEIESIESN